MTESQRVYRVLVIDDSDSDRALITCFLDRSKVYKFQIDQVDEPAKGFALLHEQNYDCVLCDFNMPQMSGIEMIHLLKNELGGSGDVPVALILLTGQGDESVAVEAIRLGAEDYLIKDRLHNGVLPRAIVKAVESYALRMSEKKTQQVLKANEKLLRLTADTIPQFLWVTEADGSTSFVNSRWQEHLGLKQEDINFGRSELLDLLHPDDRVRCKKSWEAAFSGRKPFSSEIRMRGAEDEDWRWYLCRSEPVFDEEGNLANWFGTCTDVHDLRQTQHELYERENKLSKANDELKTARDLALSANRAKSVFLASMSHEFRTPLNAVIGYSEMLAEEAEDTGAQQQHKDLNRIRSAARHLLSLIDDVLDLARVEAGEMNINMRKLDIVEVVWDAVATAQWLIEKNENELVVNIKEDCHLPVYGDPTRIRQIIFNLLSNAAKFTKKGTITLSCSVKESVDGEGAQMAQLSITDTGIGMTPEKIEKLFTPFYQGEDLIGERYGGTGLGLAISRNLCRMMNGDISISSEAGKGSTFTMTLPLAAGTAPALGSDSVTAQA